MVFEYFIMWCIICGCVKLVDPSLLWSIFTPRKSCRLPLTFYAKFDWFDVFNILIMFMFIWTYQNWITHIKYVYCDAMIEHTFVNFGLFKYNFIYKFVSAIFVPCSSSLFLALNILTKLEDIVRITLSLYWNLFWNYHICVSFYRYWSKVYNMVNLWLYKPCTATMNNNMHTELNLTTYAYVCS